MDIAARISRIGERRAQARLPVSIAARLKDRSAAARPVRLGDLSAAGCRLYPGDGLSAGDQVAIEVPGLGTLHGRTVWTAAGEAGCVFARPLDAGQLRLALALDRHKADR